jgi:hypothetical protein
MFKIVAREPMRLFQFTQLFKVQKAVSSCGALLANFL